MSWEDQGRQYHMWWGHGTAPDKVKPLPKRGNDPLFASDAFGKRIDAVAHGALMHLPRKDWSRPAASFDRTRLGQIRTAMTSWVSARSLIDAAFGQRLVDATTSGVTISALRAAATATQAAATHQDLQDASGHLAAGMLGVGLGKWPGFLRDACGSRRGVPVQ